MSTTTTPSETLYHAGVSFKIAGEIVHLYCEQVPYGYSTVAEVDDKIYYLGSELPNLTTAVFAWEYIRGRQLTQEELRQVLTDHWLT